MFKKLAAIVALALSFHASAQDYPSKPITLVVPFAPGGTVDLMGRIIAERLAGYLGQPVIVNNRPGAGGIIGTSYAVKAPADGYTLLVGTQGQVLQPLLYKNLDFDSNKDLITVATFAAVPNVLAVSLNTPANTLDEFVAYAKSNPGAINMGSAGIGSINHLVGEVFQDRAKVKLTHIPYKGAAPATADLLSGEVQALFVNLPNVMSHVSAGKIRLLGVASEARAPSIPDVPTFGEGGVKNAVLDSWYGVMVPAKTPQAVVKKIQDAVLAMTKEPDFTTKLIEVGATPFPNDAAASARIMADELELWSPVVKRLDIQMD